MDRLKVLGDVIEAWLKIVEREDALQKLFGAYTPFLAEIDDKLLNTICYLIKPNEKIDAFAVIDIIDNDVVKAEYSDISSLVEFLLANCHTQHLAGEVETPWREFRKTG